MGQPKKQNGENFMLRLATFIVDKRTLFFLITIILFIFSFFSRNWVQVENRLTEYLPATSPSKRGLDLMEEEFTTFGTAQYMIANISQKEAEEVAEMLEKIHGVQSVEYDDTSAHYNNVSALYAVTFDYDQSDDKCLEIMEKVEKKLANYDVYISTDLGNSQAEIIAKEVNIITALVAVIVVAVLIFTSLTYAEIPVLLLTFVSGMILNLGTNFFLGKISFVSNSVTSILQLALSLDYAIILSNRYKEEHATLPIREAVIVALSKSIPEIGASSLTTIGGLIAMMFMQFKIGPDMAINLIKAILLALLSVFILMPGFLMLFGPLMDKTVHKNFVPKIPFVGKFAYKTRKIIPPIFIVVLLLAYHFSSECPYAYGYGSLETPKLNETQIADQMIEENFTSSNMLALVVPAGSYEKEAALLSELESRKEVDYTMGLSNVEAMGGYMLTDELTPRQFAELTELDYEMAQGVYALYAAENEDYGKLVGSISTYSVPLIDMFLFVCDQINEGYITLDDDQMEVLDAAYSQMTNAKLQLQSEDYSRMLVYLTLPESGQPTYDFIDTIYEIAEKYYPSGDIYVVGNSTSEYDFKDSFARDNTVVSVVSIIIVMTVLLFNFKSAGMPLLLILVIQGAIWINFSAPTFSGNELFFMSYLVVSSIQMGANIDYAIVIAGRFMEAKNEMSKEDAIIEAMNFAFPTILTSGTILAVSGTLIGTMTSDAAIVGIGQSLGRGTIISIILVMFVLPQMLLLGEKIIDKTSFSVHSRVRRRAISGLTRVDGMVYGEISGTVNGIMHAVVNGDVNVNVVSGSVTEEGEDDGKNEEDEKE